MSLDNKATTDIRHKLQMEKGNVQPKVAALIASLKMQILERIFRNPTLTSFRKFQA